MPRTARLNLPERFYHVISRFIEGTWFIRGDEERETYLRMFAHAMKQTDWRCLSYAVMSNHIHLGMVAGEMPMESWTKCVNGPFAQWLNARQRRIGPLFADRPADFEVARANEANVIAYVHNNPVRAGVVCRARESDWTSHRAYAGLVRAPSWLHIEEGLQRMGFVDGTQFDLWTNDRDCEDARYDMSAIGRTLRRRGGLNTATPAGGSVQVVARPFARVRPHPLEVVYTVTQLTGVAENEVRSRRRTRTLVEARRMVIRVAKKLGLTGSDIASALGISEQAVSKVARSNVGAHELERIAVAYEILSTRYSEVVRVSDERAKTLDA